MLWVYRLLEEYREGLQESACGYQTRVKPELDRGTAELVN